jgi:hypothetical protein
MYETNDDDRELSQLIDAMRVWSEKLVALNERGASPRVSPQKLQEMVLVASRLTIEGWVHNWAFKEIDKLGREHEDENRREEDENQREFERKFEENQAELERTRARLKQRSNESTHD